MAQSTLPFEITESRADSLRAALMLVFRDWPASDREERLQEWLAPGGLPAGLVVLEAGRKERVIGAIAYLVQEGKTIVTWPPKIATGEATLVADALLNAAAAKWEEAGVRVVYAIFEEVSDEDAQLLNRYRFLYLAKLLYLASGEIDFPTSPPPGDLEFETYCSANEARLRAVIEATYEDTLDCPGLDNLRDMEDVLSGYRSTGQFHPSFWTIVRRAGADVGCLLLADYPENGNAELVYMGLIKAARGKGSGHQIARQAQWMARQAGRQGLLVAVDSRNTPATTVYTTAGFRAFSSRLVYLRDASAQNIVR